MMPKLKRNGRRDIWWVTRVTQVDWEPNPLGIQL